MGLGLGRVDARTAAALAEAVQAQSATYGDRSYFANRVPLVQARVMFAAGQFETAQQTLDIAWQADQQGLRLHHAQLLAEIDLLGAQLAAQRGEEQAAELQSAALSDLPADSVTATRCAQPSRRKSCSPALIHYLRQIDCCWNKRLALCAKPITQNLRCCWRRSAGCGGDIALMALARNSCHPEAPHRLACRVPQRVKSHRLMSLV